MVEKMNNIYLFNDYYTFVQTKREKLIFKSVNNELNQIKILEVELTKENKLKKLDIYTVINEELTESIHITKGIDGIIELDYYPLKQEYLLIDGKHELYKLDIYSTYNEKSTTNINKTLEVELIKKGHRRHKLLTQVYGKNDLFVTKDNKSHIILSENIKNVDEMLNVISKNITNLEENYQNNNFTTYQRIEENMEDSIDICDLPDEELEEILDNYPLTLFVYDRNYDLASVKENSFLYRNTEDGLLELEIYFNDTKENIKEIRFINYSNNEIEGIKTKFKIKIIKIFKNDNKEIEASLYNYTKESVNINNHAKEEVQLNATATLSEEGYIKELNLKLKADKLNIDLTKSTIFGVDFFDKENNEYRISSRSYNSFKTLLTFSKGIFNSLEKNLVLPKEEEKVKIIK